MGQQSMESLLVEEAVAPPIQCDNGFGKHCTRKFGWLIYKVLLPPLRIKLCLMKQFVKKALYMKPRYPLAGKLCGPQSQCPHCSDGKHFLYLQRIFLWFLGSPACSLVAVLAELSWLSMLLQLLREQGDPNYKMTVENMVSKLQKLDRNVSLNMAFLHSRLVSLPKIWIVSVMYEGKDFTKTQREWRSSVREGEMLMWQ
jgi:hypothetical protein